MGQWVSSPAQDQDKDHDHDHDQQHDRDQEQRPGEVVVVEEEEEEDQDQDYTTSDLPPELVQYIHALSEPLSIYSRYMDTLLVKRDDQPDFFDDLKAFRCQPRIMALLTTPASYSLASASDPDRAPVTASAASTGGPGPGPGPGQGPGPVPAFNSKEIYLSVTRAFLASRFAHPWCRTSLPPAAFLNADWSAAASPREEEARLREEARLNKLLVPIWCGFRVRMMPSDEVLDQFVREREGRATTSTRSATVAKGSRDAARWGKDDEKDEEVWAAAAATTMRKQELQVDVDDMDESTVNWANEKPQVQVPEKVQLKPKEKQNQHQQQQQKPRRVNLEAYCMELDDEEGQKGAATATGATGVARKSAVSASQHGSDAAVAANMFVGAAATGFLASNKRARKFMMKKLSKR